jgi:hypothetical protein
MQYFSGGLTGDAVPGIHNLYFLTTSRGNEVNLKLTG